MPTHKLFVFFTILLLIGSCRKDEKFLNDKGSLNFSTDFVYFDTVFTKLPGSPYPRSVNKRFMVRNPYKETVKVNVKVMGGTASPFRINVDGIKGNNIAGLEILPKDSAWVFVEATLEPNFGNDPLERDSIEFETNGNLQYVRLGAYGWDAYYYKDSVFSSDASITATDKPHVIVNTIFVDKNVTLTIGSGVHFYSTTNSTVVSGPDVFTVGAINVFGTLKIIGNPANPVIFEGDRLGFAFSNKPGQWQGLHYWRGSVNNEIRYAIIKNATVGIRVDSLPESGTFNLTVRNTLIKNMSGYGVLGLTAKLYLENTAISNCQYNTFLGYFGGDYTLIHCSFYTGSSGRKDPHVLFNNVMRDENKVPIRHYDLSYAFVNSIIWGPAETELGFDIINAPKVAFSSHNFIKSKLNLGGTLNEYAVDPKFTDPGNSNLKLKSDSPAKDKADAGNSPADDLEGKLRNDGLPDIGAYEL